MKPTMYKKLIAKIPLFRTLSQDELQEIIEITKLARLEPDTKVIREATRGNAMYILVQGSVRVEKTFQKTGMTARLADMTSPCVFGEMALVDRGTRTASVVTTSKSVLLVVDLVRFDKLRRDLRPAAYKILRQIAFTLCERLDEKMERVLLFLRDPMDNVTRIDSLFKD